MLENLHNCLDATLLYLLKLDDGRWKSHLLSRLLTNASECENCSVLQANCAFQVQPVLCQETKILSCEKDLGFRMKDTLKLADTIGLPYSLSRVSSANIGSRISEIQESLNLLIS